MAASGSFAADLGLDMEKSLALSRVEFKDSEEKITWAYYCKGMNYFAKEEKHSSELDHIFETPVDLQSINEINPSDGPLQIAAKQNGFASAAIELFDSCKWSNIEKDIACVRYFVHQAHKNSSLEYSHALKTFIQAFEKKYYSKLTEAQRINWDELISERFYGLEEFKKRMEKIKIPEVIFILILKYEQVLLKLIKREKNAQIKERHQRNFAKWKEYRDQQYFDEKLLEKICQIDDKVLPRLRLFFKMHFNSFDRSQKVKVVDIIQDNCREDVRGALLQELSKNASWYRRLMNKWYSLPEDSVIQLVVKNGVALMSFLLSLWIGDAAVAIAKILALTSAFIAGKAWFDFGKFLYEQKPSKFFGAEDMIVVGTEEAFTVLINERLILPQSVHLSAKITADMKAGQAITGITKPPTLVPVRAKPLEIEQRDWDAFIERRRGYPASMHPAFFSRQGTPPASSPPPYSSVSHSVEDHSDMAGSLRPRSGAASTAGISQ